MNSTDMSRYAGAPRSSKSFVPAPEKKFGENSGGNIKSK
jgi:hypothetical protein